MIEFTAAYEAPISLDSAPLIGQRERRSTLWTLAGVFVCLPIVAFGLALIFPGFEETLEPWLVNLGRAMIPVAALWALVCKTMAMDWGGRRVEYWLGAGWRYATAPREQLERYVPYTVREHVLVAPDFPRCVVEVATVNLRMTDAETRAGYLKRWHAFLLGVRFPVQIVVRAWQQPEQVKRRWFIAINADTEDVLKTRSADLIHALRRAGLDGRQLNGDLYDTLQACWTRAPGSRLGPSHIARTRKHVTVDGEIVRGFLLTRFPRTIDPHWLEPILDGELAVDFSVWLDPIPNAEELDTLAGKIVEAQTAQVLNVSKSGVGDPDLDDQIKDAQLTRLHLRRRKIRVFRGSVAFVVRGQDEATAHDRERLLLDQLREQVGEQAVVPLDFEHDLAPLLAVPTGYPPVQYPLQIVSPAAAMTYPFSNSSVTMDGGVDVGNSKGSGRVNRWNPFSLGNPHAIVPGTSGAGKGYWVKVVCKRLAESEAGIQVFVVQTEKDEYGPLAWSTAHGSLVRIDTLEDLERRLYPAGYQAAGALRDHTRLTVFDLTHMVAADRGRGLARLLEVLERTLTWAGHARVAVCVLDELGIVLRDKIASDAIEVAYRRFRSLPIEGNSREVSRIGMIGLTQLPSDLLGHPNGKVYAALADTHLYLRQKPSELRVTKSVLGLSPDEADYLETAEQGDALLVAGGVRVALHLNATSDEHELART